VTPAYVKARDFAARWHAGQVDKAGRPYMAHLEDVARRLRIIAPAAPEEDVQAALLHDVLEDTACSPQELGDNFGPRVCFTVVALTKPQGRPYLDFIRDLAAQADRSVLLIKLADNLSNSDPSRAFAGSARMVETKYAPARLILEGALCTAPELAKSVTVG
jgi:(p)ppGpp synthase/HD superfamily hydrolase